MPGRDTLGTSLQKTVIHGFTERRLIQAYLKLFLAAQSEDGVKTVSLARFGSYEVRVIELSRDASAGSFPVWLELYEYNTRSTLDSCGCSELEEAVAAADELITQARQLCHQPGEALATRASVFSRLNRSCALSRSRAVRSLWIPRCGSLCPVRPRRSCPDLVLDYVTTAVTALNTAATRMSPRRSRPLARSLLAATIVDGEPSSRLFRRVLESSLPHAAWGVRPRMEAADAAIRRRFPRNLRAARTRRGRRGHRAARRLVGAPPRATPSCPHRAARAGCAVRRVEPHRPQHGGARREGRNARGGGGLSDAPQIRITCELPATIGPQTVTEMAQACQLRVVGRTPTRLSEDDLEAFADRLEQLLRLCR